MTGKAKYYFQISTSSGVPIYRQIIDQVKTLIATGRLKHGVFLPSVRQIAEELEINPMTVSKAYSLLEKEKVLEFIRGQGMQVGAAAVSRNNLQKREEDIAPLLKEVIVKARQLSLNQERVTEILGSLWREENHG